MNTNELLSYKEVAQTIGVCVETVRRWANEGRFPVLKMSKRTFRVDAKDLQQFWNNFQATGCRSDDDTQQARDNFVKSLSKMDEDKAEALLGSTKEVYVTQPLPTANFKSKHTANYVGSTFITVAVEVTRELLDEASAMRAQA